MNKTLNLKKKKNWEPRITYTTKLSSKSYSKLKTSWKFSLCFTYPLVEIIMKYFIIKKNYEKAWIIQVQLLKQAAKSNKLLIDFKMLMASVLNLKLKLKPIDKTVMRSMTILSVKGMCRRQSCLER